MFRTEKEYQEIDNSINTIITTMSKDQALKYTSECICSYRKYQIGGVEENEQNAHVAALSLCGCYVALSLIFTNNSDYYDDSLTFVVEKMEKCEDDIFIDGHVIPMLIDTYNIEDVANPPQVSPLKLLSSPLYINKERRFYFYG